MDPYPRAGRSPGWAQSRISATNSSSAFVAFFEHVGIDVQRRYRIGVAKASADGPNGHAGGEELRRVGMPKVVKADAGDSLSSAKAANVAVTLSGWRGRLASGVRLNTNESGIKVGARGVAEAPACSRYCSNNVTVAASSPIRRDACVFVDFSVVPSGTVADSARHDKPRGAEIDIAPLEAAQFAATHACPRCKVEHCARDDVIFQGGVQQRPDHWRCRRFDLVRPASRQRGVDGGIRWDPLPADGLSQPSSQDRVDLPDARR